MTEDLGARLAAGLDASIEQDALARLLPQQDIPLPEDAPPMEPGGPPIAKPLSAGAALVRSLIQAPRAVARGALGAGANGVRSAANVIDLMLDALPQPGDQEPNAATRGLEPILEAVEQFIPPPDTAIGRGAEALSQFLTGFYISRRLLGGWAPASAGGEVAKSVVAGGMAESVFFDAQAGNLADLIQAWPELQNPVTEFLATDPADSAAVNRLRNAISGLAGGALQEGAVAAFKVLRKVAKTARKPAEDAGAAKPNLVAQTEQRLAKAAELEVEEQARSWSQLGYDPTAPAVRLRRVSTVDGAIKTQMSALEREAAQGDDLVRADRLGASPTRANRKLRQAVAANPTAEEREAWVRAEGGLPVQDNEVVFDAGVGDVDSELERALDALRSGDLPKPVARGPSLISFLHRIGGLKDEGGEVSTAIGGARRRPGLIRKKGLSLEDAVERAWEAGYLGETGRGRVGAEWIDEARPTPNELLDALRQEIGGSRIYPRQTRYDTAESDFIDELDKELGRAGIDLDKVDNAEAQRLLHHFYTNTPEPDVRPRTQHDIAAYHADDPGARAPTDPAASDGADRIFVNYARINTVDDIIAAIEEMLRGRTDAIDVARRGERSWTTTKLSAARVKAFDALMEQRAQRGVAIPTAERQLAMRQLWASSAEQLVELGEAVVKAPTDANRFLLRKATAVHYAIQEEVIALRTETARALNQWRIAAGTPQRRLQEMRGALDGVGDTDELARILASFKGDDGALDQVLGDVVRGSIAGRAGNALLYIWVSGLLSGPQTHVVNTVSNATVLGIRMLETKVASDISTMLGTEGGVAPGEAFALWRGYVQASRDLFTLADNAGTSGAFWRFVGGDAEAAALVPTRGKVENESLLSPLAPEQWGVARNTSLGYAIRGVAATVAVPTKMLRAEDYIFKVLNARATVHQLAVRDATAYAQLHGLDDAAIKQRIADTIANPSAEILDAADKEAFLGTFTNTTGKLGNAMMMARQSMPIMPTILTFVRTPVNLFRYYMERSPLAPMVGQWRSDIAAGGARRDMALARVSMGTAAFLAAYDMAQSGIVTGRAPSSAGERDAWRRSGRQEYSIKLPGGERWYSFSRADPVGFLLGAAGDLNQSLTPEFGQELDESAMKAVSGLILSSAYNMMSKSYMATLAAVTRAAALQSDTAAEGVVERLAGSLVPSLVATTALAIDPMQAEVSGAVDAVVARTPWASKNMPRAVDLWGRERSNASGLGTAWDVVIPVRSREENPAPIDRELTRLRYFPQRAESDVRFKLRGLPDVVLNVQKFDPELFNRYQRLAGNDAPLGPREQGAYDTLNAAIEGVGARGALYQRLRDGQREQFIETIIRQGREVAAAMLLDERPDLLIEVKERGELLKAAGGLAR